MARFPFVSKPYRLADLARALREATRRGEDRVLE
jgi:hypothetical protein